MNHELNHLLTRLIEGKCTPSEIERLEKFFEGEDQQVLEDLTQEAWNLESGPVDSEKRSRIREYLDHRITRPRRIRNFRPVWYAAAAILIVLFLVRGFVSISGESESYTPAITIELEDGTIKSLEPGTEETLEHYSLQKGKLISNANSGESSKKELTYNTIHIPAGRLLTLVLSDQTQITLNSGTSIKYPVEFLPGKKREVFLEGEAYFQVTRDEEHPFVVHTQNLNTTVLGTSFNISSYAQQQYEKVVLVEGKVLVKGPAEKKILLPETMAVFHQGSKTLTTAPTDSFEHIAWTRGVLLFQDKSFQEIVPILDLSYNVDILNKN